MVHFSYLGGGLTNSGGSCGDNNRDGSTGYTQASAVAFLSPEQREEQRQELPLSTAAAAAAGLERSRSLPLANKQGGSSSSSVPGETLAQEEVEEHEQDQVLDQQHQHTEPNPSEAESMAECLLPAYAGRSSPSPRRDHNRADVETKTMDVDHSYENDNHALDDGAGSRGSRLAGEEKRELGERQSTGDGNDGRSVEGVARGGLMQQEGEAKREMGWAPSARNKLSPTPAMAAAGTPATTTPSPLAASGKEEARRPSSLTRYPSLPLLSAGPYLSHKRPRSTGDSLTAFLKHGLKRKEQEQQQQDKFCSTLSKTRRAGSTSPGSRPRGGRKTAPILGMLQNAQDLAASPPRASVSVSSASGNNHLRRNSSGSTAVAAAAAAAAGGAGFSATTTAGTGDGGATAAGNSSSSAVHRRAARSTGVGFGSLPGLGFGGSSATSKAATPVAAADAAAAAAEAKRGGRPRLSPLNINRPGFNHEEVTPMAAEDSSRAMFAGAGEGGWGGVGTWGGGKRLRDKASSFILRLPGPKLLLQGERETERER